MSVSPEELRPFRRHPYQAQPNIPLRSFAPIADNFTPILLIIAAASNLPPPYPTTHELVTPEVLTRECLCLPLLAPALRLIGERFNVTGEDRMVLYLSGAILPSCQTLLFIDTWEALDQLLSLPSSPPSRSITLTAYNVTIPHSSTTEAPPAEPAALTSAIALHVPPGVPDATPASPSAVTTAYAALASVNAVQIALASANAARLPPGAPDAVPDAAPVPSTAVASADTASGPSSLARAETTGRHRDYIFLPPLPPPMTRAFLRGPRPRLSLPTAHLHPPFLFPFDLDPVPTSWDHLPPPSGFAIAMDLVRAAQGRDFTYSAGRPRPADAHPPQ
ncbi:hypothetical protein AURDEDRAFT_157521 [Auricularia subglabra TFB-10046 SS5]|nr:hypothetical protein AURDEDRAFT_157521 [Auricularia subglabra TFB-10046 SS5]